MKSVKEMQDRVEWCEIGGDTLTAEVHDPQKDGVKLLHLKYIYAVQMRDPFTHKPEVIWYTTQGNIATLKEAKKAKRFHAAKFPRSEMYTIRIIRELHQIEIMVR